MPVSMCFAVVNSGAISVIEASICLGTSAGVSAGGCLSFPNPPVFRVQGRLLLERYLVFCPVYTSSEVSYYLTSHDFPRFPWECDPMNQGCFTVTDLFEKFGCPMRTTALGYLPRSSAPVSKVNRRRCNDNHEAGDTR